MRTIQSRDNPVFRELGKLAASTRRRSTLGRTFLDGEHLLAAYLDAGMLPRHVLVNSAALQDDDVNRLLASLGDVPVTRLDDRLLSELSELKIPTGILAVIDVPVPEGPVSESRFALLLEDIQDPGNLGSILRSAAAAGCDSVFLSRACADAWSPKVLRAGMGGHFALQLYEKQNLPEVAQSFPGLTIATSLQASQNLYDADLKGNVAFIIGNEGAGLSPELTSQAKQKLAIPMNGQVDSLNVAAAAAVCLFEAARQRRTLHGAARRAKAP